MNRLCPLLLALALLSTTSIPARAGLITNGGFETGDFSGWSVFADFTTVTQYLDGFSPHSGNYFAALGNGGGLGVLSQTVNSAPGQEYLLSMFLGSDGSTPNEFAVEWNGTTLFDATNLGDTRGNGDQYNALSFLVQGTGNDTLTLLERNDLGYLALDDVSLSAVPEPSSLSLLIVGATCILGSFACRRSRAKTFKADPGCLWPQRGRP